MIQTRKGRARGHFDHGWLDTYHTFSFADYYDPEQMGYRVLRVINEDRIKAGEGFGEHGHRDMEIITYVISGALAHKDSMGNGSTILPGDVQYMSAGTGVTHSEFNHSKTETTHLLQIWILPSEQGAQPRYDQKNFAPASKRAVLRPVVTPDGAEGSIAIRQDMKLFASALELGEELRAPIAPKRFGWVQVVRGDITVNGTPLRAGDGAAIAEETSLRFRGVDPESEFLLFDLP